MFYTGKGDDGTSGLFGTKERFPKTSPIYEALGTVDELNSLFGVCKAKVNQESFQQPLTEMLDRAQQCLFIIQAELAEADKQLQDKDLTALEDDIALLSEHISDPQAFVVPGATELAAFLDLARTVARRAERAVLRAHESNPIGDATIAYLNRLSSLCYVLARYVAESAAVTEDNPDY